MLLLQTHPVGVSAFWRLLSSSKQKKDACFGSRGFDQPQQSSASLRSSNSISALNSSVWWTELRSFSLSCPKCAPLSFVHLASGLAVSNSERLSSFFLGVCTSANARYLSSFLPLSHLHPASDSHPHVSRCFSLCFSAASFSHFFRSTTIMPLTHQHISSSRIFPHHFSSFCL